MIQNPIWNLEAHNYKSEKMQRQNQTLSFQGNSRSLSKESHSSKRKHILERRIHSRLKNDSVSQSKTQHQNYTLSKCGSSQNSMKRSPIYSFSDYEQIKHHTIHTGNLSKELLQPESSQASELLKNAFDQQKNAQRSLAKPQKLRMSPKLNESGQSSIGRQITPNRSQEKPQLFTAGIKRIKSPRKGQEEANRTLLASMIEGSDRMLNRSSGAYISRCHTSNVGKKSNPITQYNPNLEASENNSNKLRQLSIDKNKESSLDRQSQRNHTPSSRGFKPALPKKFDGENNWNQNNNMNSPRNMELSKISFVSCRSGGSPRNPITRTQAKNQLESLREAHQTEARALDQKWEGTIQDLLKQQTKTFGLLQARHTNEKKTLEETERTNELFTSGLLSPRGNLKKSTFKESGQLLSLKQAELCLARQELYQEAQRARVLYEKQYAIERNEWDYDELKRKRANLKTLENKQIKEMEALKERQRRDIEETKKQWQTERQLLEKQHKRQVRSLQNSTEQWGKANAATKMTCQTTFLSGIVSPRNAKHISSVRSLILERPNEGSLRRA